ncbi:MAG TPA: glycosyltransferase [Ignavibacteriaceae bacterium]|nr:glycosyltransferase [Ignavibacteriaceae bacterium]
MSKTLIFYNGIFPSGSWPQRVRLTSKGLKVNGIENEVVISFWPPLHEEKSETEDNINFMFNSVSSRHYYNSKLLYLFYYFWGIIKGYLFLRKRKDIDSIIFAQGSFLECYLTLRYCKKRNIRFIIDLVDENAKKYEENRSIKDRIAIINRDLYEKQIVKRSDYLFVISSYLHEKYKQMFPYLRIHDSTPSLIDIVSNDERRNIDVRFLFPEKYDYLKSRKNRFVYAGSCARPNGIFFFFECLTELSKKVNIEFYILFFISEGQKEVLVNKAKELKILNNVYLQDAIPQKYIPAIFDQFADYLFIPEHGDICANAGFPSKTAELMGAGKPIIATDFSDLSKYLKNGHNSLLSDVGDSRNYLYNLEKILFDKQLCEVLSKNAKQDALTFFDYKQGTKNFVKVIKEK